MRKADYAALAAIIKTELTAIKRHGYDAKVRAACTATLTSVADEFANRASVDRAEFLKACGIE